LAWRARRAAGAPGQPGLLPAVARPEGAARVASGWSARRSGDERVEADRRHRQLDGEPERAGGIGLARPEGLELALPTIVVDWVDVLVEALRAPRASGSGREAGATSPTLLIPATFRPAFIDAKPRIGRRRARPSPRRSPGAPLRGQGAGVPARVRVLTMSGSTVPQAAGFFLRISPECRKSTQWRNAR